MNKYTLYNNAPIFIQNFLTTLEGKRRYKKRFGKYYHCALEQFRAFDYSDRNAIDEIKNKRFLEIVNHAFNNSPFYREFYTKHKVDISSIKSTNDIIKLPILEKDIVRENILSMYTLRPKERFHQSLTGGTTGESIPFRHTLSDYQTRLAYLDAFKERHGFIHKQMRRASFNSSKIVPPSQKCKIFWRDNKAMNQRIYSTHRCHGDNIFYYVEDINKFKPESIDGYTSSIHAVAKFILDNNLKLDFTPIAIFTTSETLYPHFRENIEKAFKCKVYDQYSSSEGATFITECSCGNLHVGEDTGIIEVLPDGEMLITSFFTHGTPLIRYKIGDKVSTGTNEFICPCGSKLETVYRLEGRTMDFILSKRFGKFTSIHLETAVDLMGSKIRAVQFVQNDLNSVHVYLEVDNNYKKEYDKIMKDELSYKLGDDMNFVFHHVNFIPKTKNGKFRFIINNLPQ